MGNAIKILILLVLAFFLVGCRAAKTSSVVFRDSVFIEKITPVVVGPDSAHFEALVKCSEDGKIIAQLLDFESNRNSRLTWVVDSLGKISADIVTIHDTIYIPTSTTIVTTTADSKTTIQPAQKRSLKSRLLESLTAAVVAILVFVLLRKIKN